MAQVWWSTLTAAGQELLPLLDPAERARLESLDRPADRGRFMVGAALLRIAVGEHAGIAPSAVEVDRTCSECGAQHGAPHIVGHLQATPWVSVSHSGLLVAVALNDHGPVGVDVQRLADLQDPAAGSEWVRREALFKAGPTAAILVRHLDAPLRGYVAALALPADENDDVFVRSWP